MATITFKVDNELKQEATELYKSMGLDLSSALRLFMKQSLVTRSIPFDITLPEAPSSVSIDHMSADEFGQMMVDAYQEAESGQSRPANEFFKEFRERHA